MAGFIDMATVTLDILEGAQASHKLIEGWAITRGAMVTGLNAGNTMNGAELADAAIAAVIAITGDRGSACPGISVPTYLDEFLPEYISPNNVKVRVVYKGLPRPTFEFEGSLNQVESNLDVNGNVLKTQYIYPTGYTDDPQKAGKLFTQGGFISRATPQPAVTIRFTIIDGFTINGVPSTATEGASWFAALQGKTNSNQYNLGVIEGQPHQWLVTRVNAVSRDLGSSYEVAITFQFNLDTWDQQIAFVNPDDGKPPKDLLPATGPFSSAPDADTKVVTAQTIGGYYAVRVYPEVVFPEVAFASN